MIAALAADNTDAFLAACGLDPLFGAQLRTDMLIYGDHSAIADFWVATDGSERPSAALSRIDGRIWLAACSAADLGELSAFLAAIGGFDRVTAHGEIAAALSLDGQFYFSPIMEYCGGYSHGNYATVTEALALDELYRINCTCFPGFRTGNKRDEWYAYTSHMIRHGFGFAAGIRENGRLASTAGAYAIGGGYGVIGNVATYPRNRDRGHAGLLVRYINDRLLEMGLVPALFCAEERLADYYDRIGFRTCGEWGRITLGGTR